jgi:hypothetical protein
MIALSYGRSSRVLNKKLAEKLLNISMILNYKNKQTNRQWFVYN